MDSINDIGLALLVVLLLIIAVIGILSFLEHKRYYELEEIVKKIEDATGKKASDSPEITLLMMLIEPFQKRIENIEGEIRSLKKKLNSYRNMYNDLRRLLTLSWGYLQQLRDILLGLNITPPPIPQDLTQWKKEDDRGILTPDDEQWLPPGS